MSSNKESKARLRWFFGLVDNPDIFENGQFFPTRPHVTYSNRFGLSTRKS